MADISAGGGLYKEQHTWADFRVILERWLQNSGGMGPSGCEKVAIMLDLEECRDTDPRRAAVLKEVLATMELLSYYWPEPKFD